MKIVTQIYVCDKCKTVEVEATKLPLYTNLPPNPRDDRWHQVYQNGKEQLLCMNCYGEEKKENHARIAARSE